MYFRCGALCLLFGYLVSGLPSSAAPVPPPTLDDLKQSLKNSDPSVRADVIEHFVISMGTVNGEASMLPSVPILIEALADPDAKVREFAISGLRGVLFFHSPLLRPSLPKASDPTTNPALQPALEKAMDDADTQVRELGLESYAITYILTPDIEDKIIAEFHSSLSEVPHQPSERPALAESLMLSRSPSPKATEFLTGLLDDPKWAPQIANCMGSDKCPLEGAALSKLVTLLSTDPSPASRQAYAGAIASYGKKAESYRSRLQAALENEKDDITRQNIQRALDRI